MRMRRRICCCWRRCESRWWASHVDVAALEVLFRYGAIGARTAGWGGAQRHHLQLRVLHARATHRRSTIGRVDPQLVGCGVRHAGGWDPLPFVVRVVAVKQERGGYKAWRRISSETRHNPKQSGTLYKIRQATEIIGDGHSLLIFAVISCIKNISFISISIRHDSQRE